MEEILLAGDPRLNSTELLSPDRALPASDTITPAPASESFNIKLNNKDLSVIAHDADTLYDASGKGYRLFGYDAAETPKITSTGGFAAGTTTGVVQANVVPELLKQYGFNKASRVTNDRYKRNVIDVKGDQGEAAHTFLVRHGIVQPNAYTTEQDITAKIYQDFRNIMNSNREKTPIDKARELVEDTLRGGNLLSPLQANTIEEYQDYVSATSNKGLQAQEESIKALEKRLLSPKINNIQRLEIQDRLNKTKESFQYNLNAPKNLYLNSIQGINNRSGGSFGELGRAMDLGWIAVKDSASNFLEYTGDVLNNQNLIDKGKRMGEDLKREKRLVDVKAGDRDITGGTVTDLDKVMEDPSKVFQFIGNSILQYGPQMGVMIGGSIAGGIAAGPVGASVVPMMMGISEAYGEQPENEKDPLNATAIGAAVGLIDRFGFSKGTIKGSDLLTKAGLHSVAAKIAVSKSISVEAATKLLNKEIFSMGRDFALLSKTVATDQLVAKKGFIDLIGNITKAAGKEAATEAVQEAIQYGAIAGTTSTDFDWEVLYKRAREAAVVGGILGGTLGGPSAAYGRSSFNQELNTLAGVETRTRTNNSLMEQEERIRNGGKLNDIELAYKMRSYKGAKGDGSLEQHILPGAEASILNDTKSLLSEGGLFASSRDNATKKFLNFEGGREIAGILDAPAVRGVYSGMSAFKRIHAIANSVTAMLPNRTQKRASFGTDNGKEIGAVLMDSLNGGTANKAAEAYRNNLNQIGLVLSAELRELGPHTNVFRHQLTEPDFFLKNQVVDPQLVKANSKDFLDALIKNWEGRNPKGTPDLSYFKDLQSRLSENMSYREMHELKDMGVLDNPAFNKFRSKDIEYNIGQLVEMISRSAVKNAIFGTKGEVLANGISKMLDAGEITKEQASQLAVDLQQQMEAFDGRLGKIKSPTAAWLTNNLTFATTLIYMDTSIFANMAEIVYGSLGLSPANMFKYFGRFAKEFSKDVFAKTTQLGSKMSGGVIKGKDETELSEGMDLLQQTGHFGKMNDISFNVGANINTQAKRNLSKLMFKANLVEASTNAVRAARGSIAADEINNLVAILAAGQEGDTARWAKDRLSYYRMDPDRLVEIYNSVGALDNEALSNLSPNDPLFQEIRIMMRDGITNFIDEFSSRPEPGSTGKIFDNQRWALFTQFKKFTWHFTSNVIPQLWNMYLKRGDVKYTYSAFSMVMVAFLMAYTGMYLKGFLRGEEEEDDEKLLAKRFKQAFDYSWGQAPSDVYKAVSNATATYPDGSLKSNPIDSVVGQSASLGTLKNTGKDLYGIMTKDADQKEKANLIKRIPVFGEIPGIRAYFEKDK